MTENWSDLEIYHFSDIFDAILLSEDDSHPLL